MMSEGSRYVWWYANCETHGEAPHLFVLNGRCELCERELQKKLGPPNPRPYRESGGAERSHE